MTVIIFCTKKFANQYYSIIFVLRFHRFKSGRSERSGHFVFRKPVNLEIRKTVIGKAVNTYIYTDVSRNLYVALSGAGCHGHGQRIAQSDGRCGAGT